MLVLLLTGNLGGHHWPQVLTDGGERLVGRLQHQGEVAAGHGGGHEPVVPGMQVGAAAQGLRREHVGQLVVPVPGEGEVRHHRRAGVADRPGPTTRACARMPVAQRRRPARSIASTAPLLAQRADGGDRRRHRHGREPERAGDEHLCAPPRKASLPEHRGQRWPFAMALLQADRSGSTPTGSQLEPRCSRNPQRTSSRISAAPVASHSARRPRANAGSTSSWSYPASCLNGLTRMAARSSPASAAACRTLARSL